MSFVALACSLIAVDGDTLRCGQEVIRLVGIDAPELPGHCREGRDCAPGDPLASKRALEAVSRGIAVIDRQGRDIYDRTLARIRVNGVDLSCAQLASAHAIYRSDWDQFGLVRADCGIKQPAETAPPSPRVAAARKRPLPAETTGAGWSYRNCGEARRAGAAPLYRGRPGYGAHMDGDGDGIACEPYKSVTR
ncbi:thermonuclease family protein [Sphingomonas sp. RS2018]